MNVPSTATSRLNGGLLRRDLLAAPRETARRRYWLIHDPLRRRFLRLGEREFQQLRSGRAADPRVLGLAQQNGLLIGPGQPIPRRTVRWSNPLYLPLVEIRVAPLIDVATRLCGWVFAPAAMLAGLGLIAIAAGIVLSRWSVLVADLPTFAQFFGPRNWLPLLAVLAATKVLHELGHAVACRRFGAACDSVGLLLLCFTPCLYCDVTDAWRLPRRAARAAVVAAGIYVELLLASMAAIVWTQTLPGPVHFLGLNIMFVCGVSSLLFNGNPLMRYDGYYLLSDLVDATNLRLEAADAWQRVVEWTAGVVVRVRSVDVALAGYHVSAVAYRLLVIGLIGAWLFALLDGFGLRSLAIVGSLVAAVVLVRGFSNSVARWVRGRGRWSRIPPRGRIGFLLAVFSALGVLLLVPMPHRVSAEGCSEVRDGRTIYVTTAGVLDEVLVQPGDTVRAGQLLARLAAPRLQRERMRLEGTENQLLLESEGLRQQSFYEPAVLERLATKQAALEAVRLQQTLVARQLAQLELRSPAAGVVIPPRGDLLTPEQWLGRFTPGQSCAEGLALYRIAAPNDGIALLRIPARDRPLVGLASTVRLSSVGAPGAVCDSTVESISEITDDTENASTALREFEVRCALPEGSRWRPGTEVCGTIEAGRRTLAARLWHAIRSAWRG